MEEIINSAIEELAKKHNCSPHMVTWEMIAKRLAYKLKKPQINEA